MFYGSSSGASMSLPSKSRLKRQSRTFTQVLYRTLSYRDRVPVETGTNTRGDRRSTTEPPERPADDPAELSTQSSAPGVLKIFGDEICAGANYKSVLATPRSSAQELVKEALERYSLNKNAAHSYVLCDVIGRLEGGGGIGGGGWRTECLRALGDNEKPLLLQELWKPREGHARRFELRRRAEVEELNAKEKDTVTADINAQARKLQRNRAKGTLTLPRSSNSSFCRSLSETSLNQLGVGDEPKRYYSTLPGPLRSREREAASSGRRKEEGSQGGGGVRHSLYQSPHLLLLQGYNRQDCLVYLLNREQHTVGQETPSARPNICLFSPDILPLHCRLRRVPAPRRHANNNNKGEEQAESQQFCVAVEPVLHATVLVNFSRCERSTTLRHGDLLSFGAHYIFLYKDPTSAKPLPAQTLARLRSLGQLYDVGVEEGEGGAQTWSKESLLSATISANEEAMTILEEVIMYTFQQCVYYVTKVFQNAQELLQGYQVHPEIQAQMFAYLFFFSNVSLFNQLMDKGPSRGWFQRSKVLQIQACLRMVMEWASRSGLGHLADKFFTKLNSTVSILATPPQQLTQLSWRALSSEHPTLKPVQLHRILTQYQLTAEMGPVPSWQPSSEDEAYIYRTVDLLESFENHPPIVLPSAGFRVDLDSECVEDSIYRQLLYIRHYLWGLRTKTQTHTSTPSVHTHSNGTNTADWPDVQRELLPPSHSSPRSGVPGDEVTAETGEERGRDRPSVQSHTHSLRRNGTMHHPRTANPDPSCLLTPPNTPLYPEGGGGGPGSIIGPNTQTNGCTSRTVAECKRTNGLISNGMEVELDKGPYGLGMGLIDGLHTPLNAPGIYIRTLIPDGPAASDGRLRIGDRILAVNGTSLIGADYQSAVDLIRLGGGRLRFLVAKSDPDVSEKISASSC
ncbi:Ras-associating and dilute domain-containing protein [Larimichthys crocea]|uniref:Uncharacterized protein n=1 Tax=Larimichthys crocea TaxID=215358 RepID=A0ACD3RWF4_LARCR|nr:Ras-associating and dilute domain-containing protein [Larimichthys crocea]